MTADAPVELDLTDIQQAYWAGESDAFQLGGVRAHAYLEIVRAGLDVERYRRAWRRLVERHPMLRAELTPDGRQRILPEAPGDPVELVRVGDDREAAAAQLAALRQCMVETGPTTDRWPLFEVRVVPMPDGPVHLLLSISLLVCDASSTAVLLGELAALYDDADAPLPSPAPAFRDHVTALAAPRPDRLHRDREYWQRRLAELPPAPDLPLRGPLPDRPAFVRHGFRLDTEKWSSLRRRAGAARLTPTGALLAAYGWVLGGWSATRPFTVSVLHSTRPDLPGAASAVGNFTATVLLAVGGPPGEAFRDRGARLQRRLWSDLEHGTVSGVRVLGDWKAARGATTEASMPVTFVSALHVPPPGERAARWLRDLQVSRIQTPQVLLDTQVFEDAGELQVNWDVVEEAFLPGTPARMLADYHRLLEDLAAGDEAWERPEPPPPHAADLSAVPPVVPCAVPPVVPSVAPAVADEVSAPAAQPVDASAEVQARRRRIAELWAELLDGGPVPHDQGFLDLGGRSLAAMRLAIRIEREFGCDAVAGLVFQGATVAVLADHVAAVARSADDAALARPGHPAPDHLTK